MPYSFMNKPIANALYEALTQDPFYITLEQKASVDPARAKNAMLKYMDYSMKEARAHGKLYLTKDLTHGAALWSKPVEETLSQQISKEKKGFLLDHLGRKSLEIYCQIVAFMSEKSRMVVSDSFWYLSILGISPDHQGNGLGRDLVLPVLEITDKIGAATYLESFTPKNFGFYKRLGFYEAKTVHEPFTDSDYTIMIRDAQ